MNHVDRRMASALAAVIGLAMVLPAHAASCDRACLKGLADRLIASMVAHDASHLPLARTYAATENSAPSALGMMAAWRTPTAAKGSYYVIDPQSQQLFLIATMSEGPNDSLLYGRMRVQEGLISELELYTNRSRGQSGFQFSPNVLANFPGEWTMPIAPGRRASRTALLQAGRSIFDTRVKAPDIAPGCVLMENGKVVEEDAEVAQSVAPANQAGAAPVVTAGKVPIHCGNPPIRPTDKLARTDIIDEEQGVVVSIAIVNAMVEPYLVTQPTESAVVPNSMRAPYEEMLTKQQSSGKYQAPALRPMPATQVVAELHRIYDGKLQAMQMLQSTGAPGSTSPWTAKP